MQHKKRVKLSNRYFAFLSGKNKLIKYFAYERLEKKFTH